MNSPHFFFFSFLIFLIGISVIAGNVSAYESSTISPNMMIDEGPGDAFMTAYNGVVDWWHDLADDSADMKDNISSLSDIPGAVWNFIINRILKAISYPMGLLAGMQAWYEAFWLDMANQMSPTMTSQSIDLISSVFIFLVFILFIRLYVFVLDVVPMI